MSEIGKKDYCSSFPEEWVGVYIGECCKIHDQECSTRQFFRCLRAKVGIGWATVITTGGALGCWVKYTKIMINRI